MPVGRLNGINRVLRLAVDPKVILSPGSPSNAWSVSPESSVANAQHSERSAESCQEYGASSISFSSAAGALERSRRLSFSWRSFFSAARSNFHRRLRRLGLRRYPPGAWGQLPGSRPPGASGSSDRLPLPGLIARRAGGLLITGHRVANTISASSLEAPCLSMYSRTQAS